MALELERKAGPLPVWGWAVVIAVGGYVLYKRLFSGGGAPVTSNAVSPGQVDTGGGSGYTPIYLAPPGATPAGTSTDITPPAFQISPADPNINNLASTQPLLGAFGAASTAAQQIPGMGYYQPGSSQRGILQIGVDPTSGIAAVQDATGAWGGVKFASPQADWQVRANNAINQLLSVEPATVPVGDLYGTVGMQTPELARAGGYWGSGGQWIATPTPWTPLQGQPPSGTGIPGQPYITGSGTGNAVTPGMTGTVQGTPTHYTAWQDLATTLSGHG